MILIYVLFNRLLLFQALKKDCYNHYTAIYHLLLDRMRLHRSSFPIEKQSYHQRRPSTVADNALNHSKFLQQAQHAHAHHMQLAEPAQHLQLTDHHQSVNCMMSSDSACSVSAESGLEMDIDMPDPAPSKPPLARRHTLTAMTGIPGCEEGALSNFGGTSMDSGHGMGLPSEATSIESNLDLSDSKELLSLNPMYSNQGMYRQHYNQSEAGQTAQSHGSSSSERSAQRNTRSPINFREGRRASDGLVCQDVVAFKQKLREGMKAGGMLDIGCKQNQLAEDYGQENGGNSVTEEPPMKIPLGKRMSLPTSSIDLPPHRMLEIKKSIQLDRHLGISQDVSEMSPPFGALRCYETLTGTPLASTSLAPLAGPSQPFVHLATQPFGQLGSSVQQMSQQPSLQRQMHHNRMMQRKQASYKQQSAMYQQFQQMHIEQTSLVSATGGMSRGGKHPPITRQPSYKLALQQPIMPTSTFHNADTIPMLPWDPSDQNFLLQMAVTSSMTMTSSSQMTTMSNGIQQSLDSSNHLLMEHNQDVH